MTARHLLEWHPLGRRPRPGKPGLEPPCNLKEQRSNRAHPAMFEINQHNSILRRGTNILAIHGLNDQLSSLDMLVAPPLSAGVPRKGQA